MTAGSMVNPSWNPPPGVWVQPIYGWGCLESIDGELAPAFEARIDAAGVDVGEGIRGWCGAVLSPGHKYSGMALTMTPRHTSWSGVVVATVKSADTLVFSGMADTSGLECDWE